MASLGPARAKRQLRHTLRMARDAVELTQQDVADGLDWSLSKVQRMENGQVSISTSDLMALLTLYGVTEQGRRTELVELARASRQPTIATGYTELISKIFAEWLEHEAAARVIRWYQDKLIPGVLQTRAYMTAVIRAYLGAEAEPKRVEQLADLRQLRSANLLGDGGPEIHFLIDEAALRRAVGGEEGRPDSYAAMIEQLEHLKAINTIGRLARGDEVPAGVNQRVRIQIVPLELGAYHLLRGPVELLEFGASDGPNLAYFEGPRRSDVISDNLDEIDTYLEEFAALQRRLAEPAETDDQLDFLIQLMRKRQNGISGE